jgi:hypothetical protein
MPLGPIAFAQHVGAASAPLAPAYRPRQPQRTILHRVVNDHLETMLDEARARSEHGFGYPRESWLLPVGQMNAFLSRAWDSGVVLRGWRCRLRWVGALV